MKRPALQNKRVTVLGMALRARKVFGTFEKRAPGMKKYKPLKAISMPLKSSSTPWIASPSVSW